MPPYCPWCCRPKGTVPPKSSNAGFLPRHTAAFRAACGPVWGRELPFIGGVVDETWGAQSRETTVALKKVRGAARGTKKCTSARVKLFGHESQKSFCTGPRQGQGGAVATFPQRSPKPSCSDSNPLQERRRARPGAQEARAGRSKRVCRWKARRLRGGLVRTCRRGCLGSAPRRGCSCAGKGAQLRCSAWALARRYAPRLPQISSRRCTLSGHGTCVEVVCRWTMTASLACAKPGRAAWSASSGCAARDGSGGDAGGRSPRRASKHEPSAHSAPRRAAPCCP